MCIRSALALVMESLLFAAFLGADSASVCGAVRGEDGEPLAGAVVRIRGDPQFVTTASDGTFCLPVRDGKRSRVVAWSAGYVIAGRDAEPGETVELILQPWGDVDAADYEWLPARIERSVARELAVRSVLRAASRAPGSALAAALKTRLATGCRDCHRTVHDEWAASGHARGAFNERFMSMYFGTNLDGEAGQPTRYVHSRDYGWRPLLPDPTRAHFGPGYKLDFPRTAGNCAACHLPGAAVGSPFESDPSAVDGVDREGIHCDFCHKMAAVVLDAETGLPPEGRPGVASIAFARPAPGTQLFLGSLDDVDAGVDTFLPLMKQSEICAPCHQGSFWGTPIYESFAEWKASGYAKRGITCQNCHMKPTGTMHNVAPARGGIARPPTSLASHDFAGVENAALMRESVRMDVVASREDDGVVAVTVTVSNVGAGHHVPTDSPMRHLILLVRAASRGRDLPLRDGATLPRWCGTGDLAAANYGGLPGKVFAKILEETWTRVSPSAAYWNPTRIVSDTRIPAEASDASTFRFDATGAEDVEVRVELIYRRAFKQLIEQKGWDLPDLVLATRRITAARHAAAAAEE